ncbi:hypothetical protein [Actinomadura macra]|uniref:hypothetical protein n=1 Tax=Actinomadura macra TaxID=46164 RepID=UPI0012FA59FB|nr:hypothetical protein [Actinomadura macra]
MPKPIESRLTDYLCELARLGGALVDSGASPPGKPLDAVGIEYTVSVDDVDACIEYMVIADIKEFYIADIVWAG